MYSKAVAVSLGGLVAVAHSACTTDYCSVFNNLATQCGAGVNNAASTGWGNWGGWGGVPFFGGFGGWRKRDLAGLDWSNNWSTYGGCFCKTWAQQYATCPGLQDGYYTQFVADNCGANGVALNLNQPQPNWPQNVPWSNQCAAGGWGGPQGAAWGGPGGAAWGPQGAAWGPQGAAGYGGWKKRRSASPKPLGAAPLAKRQTSPDWTNPSWWQGGSGSGSGGSGGGSGGGSSGPSSGPSVQPVTTNPAGAVPASAPASPPPPGGGGAAGQQLLFAGAPKLSLGLGSLIVIGLATTIAITL